MLLDLINIAADLAADTPKFMRLVYVTARPVIFRKGGAMTRYSQIMRANDTPLLLLPDLPDALNNVVPVSEKWLSVYPGGVCWYGKHHQDNRVVQWESFTVTTEILERVSGNNTLRQGG